MEHPERDRIHKLLYWVCKGKWESSSPKLNETTINLLLQELVQNASSFEVLERRLHKAASVLNKTNTYTRIATLIAYSCADFYAALSTQFDGDEDAEEIFTCIVVPENADPMSELVLPVASPDRFELRRFLMQQIPPLKIKILLFSVLRYPFSFDPRDWMLLKTKTLDEWVEELVQTFPSMPVLEQKLIAQANALSTLDQATQVADIVVQALQLKVR